MSEKKTIEMEKALELLDNLFPSKAPHHFVFMSNEEYNEYVNPKTLKLYEAVRNIKRTKQRG